MRIPFYSEWKENKKMQERFYLEQLRYLGAILAELRNR